MQKLIGLVACGGKSVRMGKDKSRLNYHGKEQRYFVYEMLQGLCDEVYIACNHQQYSTIVENYKFILDEPEYAEIGPMAALLSVSKKFPEASFLLVGCDYPLVKTEDLQKLIQARSENYNAVCYFNKQEKMEEPLLAIYEKPCLPILKKKFEKSEFSLRYFLKDIATIRVQADTPESIVSIDTLQEAGKINKNILLTFE